MYQSSARVYVDTQSLLRPLLRGLTVETNPDNQIRLMVRTLLSRPNLERISRMTDLDVQANTTEEYDAIIEALKKDLKITSAGRENIFTLSIENKDAEVAKNIVQSALTVFIENTLGETRSDSDEAQKFLNAQIRDYENRLVSAETRLTSFKQKYGNVLLSNSGGFYATLNNEEEQLERAQLQLEEAKTRLASAQAQLLGEEPAFGMFTSRVKTNNSVATAYDSRIEQLEATMDEKLLRFTENHPEVQEIKRRLDELNRLRTEEIEAYYATIQTSDDDSSKTVTSIDKIQFIKS